MAATVPDQSAFAVEHNDEGEWIFTENHWYDVGNGSFVPHCKPVVED